MEKVLSVPDLESIKTYIHSWLSSHDRITTSDVYLNVKGKLVSQYDEAAFRVQLSKAIKDGRLGSLTIVRGPYGGIKLAVSKPVVIINQASLEAVKPIVKALKEAATVQDVTTDNEEVYQEVAQALPKPYFSIPTPIVKVAPPPVVKHALYLKGTKYEVPHTINEIKTLINNVLELVEDSDGAFEFDGIKYACSDEQLKFLDKFLFFFYGASYETIQIGTAIWLDISS